nr:MAG: replication initiator protein [Microvirus sp.]
MCLYPKLIVNRKYISNIKNKGIVPELKDERTKYVPVGCGNCIECRRKKANEWKVRLNEELKINKGTFVTLSFDEEKLDELCKELKVNECNAVAKLAVKRFNERYRKQNKHAIRHWLISELGHNNTERLHIHGILFETISKEDLKKYWKYGMVYTGYQCNLKTINYVVKYITKIDKDHKGFKGEILCSPGIGKAYIGTTTENQYKGTRTKEYYRLQNGQKISLPIYYRNKIYTEEQREKLWINKLNEKAIWVGKRKIDVSTVEEMENYLTILKEEQEKNIRCGFGSDENEWKKRDYNVTLRKINKEIKLEKLKES